MVQPHMRVSLNVVGQQILQEVGYAQDWSLHIVNYKLSTVMCISRQDGSELLGHV